MFTFVGLILYLLTGPGIASTRRGAPRHRGRKASIGMAQR